ncbi:unnamed protein product, partial [Ascophyllum nodosum]
RPKRQVGVASLGEIAPHLKALANRYLTQGFRPIQVYWTDLCCGDRSVVQSTLRPASEAVPDFASSTYFGGEAERSLPSLEFPAHNSPILMRVVSENCEHCTRICVGLLKRARESTPAVLGFDIEWSVRPSEPRRQVSLLQLSARDGYTVLFHLKYDERRAGIMPKALKELLVNDTVQLAGVLVRGDLKHLLDSYGVQGTNPVDVGQLAGTHLGVKIGARSLQALTATLLRRQLAKDTVRTSNWETALSKEQEKYAGLDSYAGVLLFYHIWARMDPIFTERRPDVLSLPVNTPLRLYTSTNSRCVAEGTLIDYPQRSTWGSTGLTIGRVTGGATRMVIKLTARHIPGAFTLHPGKDGGQVQALDELELGALVLWDAINSRLPADPGPVSSLGVVGVGDVAGATGTSSTSTLEPGGKVGGPTSLSGAVGVGDVAVSTGNGSTSTPGPEGKWKGWRPPMDRVRRVWKQRYPSWSNQEIAADMRAKLSSHLLKHVPRIVPRPEILLPRYDNVIETFKVVRDGATGDTLFTDRMHKAAALLRVHIEKGCLSDPNPDLVPLLQIMGRTKDGLDLIRSLKGTNRVENYHQLLRQLMGSYHASAIMAHYTMLLHNYRRNHRMAGLHRGMDPDLLGYYSHWEIEDIKLSPRGGTTTCLSIL